MRLARSKDASANVEGALAHGLRESHVMHATARHSEVEKGGALETASCLVRIIPCFRVEGMMQYGACVPLAAFTAQSLQL